MKKKHHGFFSFYIFTRAIQHKCWIVYGHVNHLTCCGSHPEVCVGVTSPIGTPVLAPPDCICRPLSPRLSTQQPQASQSIFFFFSNLYFYYYYYWLESNIISWTQLEVSRPFLSEPYSQVMTADSDLVDPDSPPLENVTRGAHILALHAFYTLYQRIWKFVPQRYCHFFPRLFSSVPWNLPPTALT